MKFLYKGMKQVFKVWNFCIRVWKCLNPFRRWSSVTRVKVGFRISAKCAGSAALHSTVLVSLSHMNTIWSNTAGCAVRTPWVTPASPHAGRVLFMKDTTSPNMQLWSWATRRGVLQLRLERRIKGRRRPWLWPGWPVDMSAASRRTPVAGMNAASEATVLQPPRPDRP